MQFHGRDGVFMPRKVPLAKGTEGHGSKNQEAGLRKCDVGDLEDSEQRRAPAPRSLLSICVFLSVRKTVRAGIPLVQRAHVFL